MGEIRIQIKVPFGEIVVEGSSTQEILEMIKTMPPEFVSEVGSLISSRLAPPPKMQLEGIIELTTEGPILTARQKLTHYEAIGLVLYASEDQTNTAAKIDQLLKSSGIKSRVQARLLEMTKRRMVFKPDHTRPEFKLTAQGEKWIEEEVLVKLRGATN